MKLINKIKSLFNKEPRLNQLVRKEAKALREELTDRERDRLILELLNPMRSSMCIYGLATRYCFSNRALELIQKCTKIYFTNPRYSLKNLDDMDETNKIKQGSARNWSPIEVYIANIKDHNLIPYLKKETNKLILS